MDKKLLDLCYKKYNKELNMSWDELGKQHGFTGEILRAKFKKYRKLNGELPSREKLVDANVEKKLDDAMQREIQLKKERVKLQDMRTAINREVRQIARKESLNDLIRESIKDLSPLVFKSPEHLYGEENEMVIMFNDSHFASVINNEFEIYNEQVFIDRLANYAQQILEIKKKEKVNKCHLCFAGDVISGEIHLNIVKANQYGIVEQVKRFSEYASRFVELLSRNFEEVNVHFVTGNHTRNGSKDDSLNRDRYENFISEFIKLRTEQLYNVIFGKSILDNTVAEFYSKGNYCVVCHGDYGVKRNESNKLFSLLGKKVDLIFLGHTHVFDIQTVDRCKVITSGCWCNNGEYETNHRYIGEPSQTVTIVGEKGFICAYDCNLKK